MNSALSLGRTVNFKDWPKKPATPSPASSAFSPSR